LLTLSFFIGSCLPQDESLIWEKVTAQTIGKTDFSHEDKARLAVITDRDEVRKLRDQIYPHLLEQIQTVDFSAYLIVTVFQGQKGSTGYSVEVVNVQRKDKTITIHAQFHEPGPRDLTNPLVTSPYYVLKIKKTPGLKDEFTFVLNANGEEVTRQTQRIP
jgi:hypothetical protein